MIHCLNTDCTTANDAIRGAACDADRAWFLAHPNATQRIRPYVPGEAGAYTPNAGTRSVLVEQIAPGIRQRTFICSPNQRGQDMLITFDPVTGEVVRVYDEQGGAR